MHDLNTIYNSVLSDVISAGIEPGKIESLIVNRRTKSRLGQCKRRKTESGETICTIEISEFMLQDSVIEQELKNVIAHEILHTCPGSKGHGEKWKTDSYRFMRVHPEYRITRTTNIAATGAVVKRKPKVIRYQLKCERCGKILQRQKASNFTKYPEYFRHKHCGGSFKLVG